MVLVLVAGLLSNFSLPAKAADTKITSGSISITSANTYTIADAMQLGYLRDIVNGGNNCAGVPSS